MGEMSTNKPRRLIGTEQLVNGDSRITNAEILDFWRYAFSDLKANNIRGILAEWIVAKLLNLPLNMRDPWAEWDLDFENYKLEVKASAYLQIWKQKQLSKIIFTGLKKHRLNQKTNKYAKTATYNANWYVFCVQIETDAQKWDALDLSQWRFYVVPKAKIRGRQSVSLKVVETMSEEMTANEFRRKAKKLIKNNGRK